MPLLGYSLWYWFAAVFAALLVLDRIERYYRARQHKPKPDITKLHRKVIVEEVADRPENPRVFLEITIADKRVGRIEIELFASLAPRTCENFRCLCTGEKGFGKYGLPLWFNLNKFHRVIPDFMCQAGDLIRTDGTGGESIYGDFFDDEWENGYLTHDRSMLLSMANLGPERPNSNSSQFFITTMPAPSLDGNHVGFGRVISGGGTVKRIEFCGTPGEGKPDKEVLITACGELPRRGK